MNKLKAGDTVWMVYSNRKSGENVVVKKVGREYGYLKNGVRFRLNSFGVLDDSYCNERDVFASESHWRNALIAEEAWNKFRDKVSRRFSMIRGLTVERIEAAEKILFEEQK